MELKFEPTNSFCYRFSRYKALPEILDEPEVILGEDFHLLPITNRVIDRHLTPEQLAMTFVRSKSGAPATIRNTIKFYVPFLAKNLGLLTRVGGGMYRLPVTDEISEEVLETAEQQEDATTDDEDVNPNSSGSVYAYSFPLLVKADAPFPIKIGKASGDVQLRVRTQVQRTGSFEEAVVLGTWRTTRVSALESAIHGILKARGKWRDRAPGTEWFDTTIEEISQIVAFVGVVGSAQTSA